MGPLPDAAALPPSLSPSRDTRSRRHSPAPTPTPSLVSNNTTTLLVMVVMVVVAAFAEKRTRRTCTSIKTGLSQEIRDLIAGKCLEPSLSPRFIERRGRRLLFASFHLVSPSLPRSAPSFNCRYSGEKLAPYSSSRRSSRVLFLLFFFFSVGGRRDGSFVFSR